jgi:hypothetical protein
VLIYTGSGLKGREIDHHPLLRDHDHRRGRTGTLGEFAIAYDEGRLIGVLTGTGGVADMVGELTTRLAKTTGATVLYDDDPEQLLQPLIPLLPRRPLSPPQLLLPTHRADDDHQRRRRNGVDQIQTIVGAVHKDVGNV